MNLEKLLIASLVAALCPLAHAQDDNIGHTRHLHRWGQPHPAVPPTPERFTTTRSGRSLDLPREDDAFFFVVYGDRTGGPADGVSVLADAVRDTNLLEPDFVMTVGDLINGYNRPDAWMEQMREFHAIMDNLLCPWFPVAGNHDIYWRPLDDADMPRNQHEAAYEMHFGPLWYAFSHKNCMFIALYSDEGDPFTGEKAINKPAAQVMSEAQFTWLKDMLSLAKDKDHVFLFLHHPRWLGGNYGSDWDKVHAELVKAGNVSAVFAGHIHRMRYDPKDGIDYIALATVGGGQSGTVPEAGWLHHYNIVTVRKDQIAHAALPVGDIMDPREITGEMGDHAARLARVRPAFDRAVSLDSDAAGGQTLSASVTNPTPYPVDATLTLDTPDSRWFALPDHNHARLEPGETRSFPFHVERLAGLDRAFVEADIALDMDMLLPGHRYTIPTTRAQIPLDIQLLAPNLPARELAMEFDGSSGHVKVPHARFSLPDGPFTLECWMRADAFSPRTGLIAKTENSEYGFFVNNGVPSFSLFLDDRYAEATPANLTLDTNAWHHLAGVYDGSQVRLYVNGSLAAKVDRAGRRRTNERPLIIGADVSDANEPVSFFDGRIDAVRLSTGARYGGESFTPLRRLPADDATLLLYNMDALVGPWIYDEGSSAAHVRPQGAARLVDADQPGPP